MFENRSFIINVEELSEAELQWSRTKLELRDVATSLSTSLVPAFTEVFDIIGPGIKDVSDFARENRGVTTGLLIGVGVLGAASVGLRAYSLITGVATAASGLYTAVTNSETASKIASNIARGASILVTAGATVGTWALTAATTAFGVAMYIATGPIGLVVLGLGALAAGGYLLYRNWETVRSFVGDFWDEWGGWITTGLAVVTPFIGIPLLIWRNWETMTGLASAAWNYFTGLVTSGVIWIVDGVHDAVEAFNSLPLVPDVDLSGVKALRAELDGSADVFRQARTLGVTEVGVQGVELATGVDVRGRSLSPALAGGGGGAGGGFGGGSVIDNRRIEQRIEQRNEITGVTDPEEVADLVAQRTSDVFLDTFDGGSDLG